MIKSIMLCKRDHKEVESVLILTLKCTAAPPERPVNTTKIQEKLIMTILLLTCYLTLLVLLSMFPPIIWRVIKTCI